MDKSNYTEEPNLFLKTLVYSTPIVALITLLSYGYATVYQFGYMRAFGVDLRMITFVPDTVDVILWGAVVCALLTISALMYHVFLYGLKLLGANIQRLPLKVWLYLQPHKDEKVFSRRYKTVSTIILTLILAIFLVFYIADRHGYNAATTETSFTVIIGEGDEAIDVLLYEHNGIGVFKQYSISDKLFGDTYTIDSTLGKPTRHVSLERIQE